MAKSLILKDEIHARLKKVADIQGKNLTIAGEEAINRYADRIEYGKEAFYRLIDDSTKLKVYSDMLKKEFSEAPLSVYKDIITLKEKCSGDIEFNSLLLPDSNEEFKKMFNEKLEGMFLIIESIHDKVEKAKEEVTKIMSLIENSEQDDGVELNTEINVLVKLNTELKEGTNRLFVFACYKKESEKKEDDTGKP